MFFFYPGKGGSVWLLEFSGCLFIGLIQKSPLAPTVDMAQVCPVRLRDVFRFFFHLLDENL